VEGRYVHCLCLDVAEIGGGGSAGARAAVTGISADDIAQILVRNPSRFLAFVPA
jgi:hypothetical protein